MRRIVSIIFIVFLLGLSAFAFKIQSAKAQSGETIVINPNGTISSPVTANITISENETYTFNGSNYLPIVVNRSNIKIDGRGYTLQGNGTSTGFSLTKVSNVTIKNTAITNSLAGIYLSSSSGNTLSSNNATRDGYGIELYSSSGNTLSGNNVTASYFGIFLYLSSGNVLSDNLMAGNTYNFYVYGSVLSDYVNHVDTSNLVNGKPVYYLMNQSSIVISPQTCLEGVGYLGLVNCKNMTVQGLTLARNGQGLLLAFTNDTEVNNVNVTANSYGIVLYSSSGNTLSGNNVTANLNDGIDLFSSPSNVLSGNNVTANTWDGIYLFFSSGNRIFHNDFVNNKHQTYIVGSTDTWDNGYPSGGNYWSDYRTSYPSAVENDSSGTWNTPYNVSSGNIDRYPLMAQFYTFNVGTWNGVTYGVGMVSNSTIKNVEFNSTARTLNFNVTGMADTLGFCRVDIPFSLMSGSWNVTVNGKSTSFNTLSDANYTYIYFTYTQSPKTVQITSTTIFSEFQPCMLLPLFMIITLLGAIVLKKKRDVKK